MTRITYAYARIMQALARRFQKIADALSGAAETSFVRLGLSERE